MPDPRSFDPNRPLVMAGFNTINGFAMTAGERITIADEPTERGEVTLDTAARLWSGGKFVYQEEARPTPVESPQDAARRLVTVEDLGGGWYLVLAPWLEQGEKIQGEEAANKRRDELIEGGQPIDTSDTATIRTPATPAETDPLTRFSFSEQGSNGWYEVTGPGLDEPLKIRGEDAALAKVRELEEAAARSAPDATETGGESTGGKTAAEE